MACLLVFPQQFLYSMGVGGVLVALAAGLVALLPLPALPLLARPADRRSGAAPPAAGPLGRPLGASRRLGDEAARAGWRRSRRRSWSCSRCPRSASTSSASTRRRCRPRRAARQVAEALDREASRDATPPITALRDAPPPAAASARGSRRSPGVAAAAAAASGRARALAPRSSLPRGEPLSDETAALVRDGAARAPLGAGHRTDRRLRRPAGFARRPPPVGARDPRADDLHPHLPLHRLRRAAAQVAAHERADARCLVRHARARLRVGPRACRGSSRPSRSSSARPPSASRPTTRSSSSRGSRRRATAGSRTGPPSPTGSSARVGSSPPRRCSSASRSATFATSGISFIQELGVGIAVAVLLDATIVRALLVPSLMAMLGRWNWWAPEPLRRLHRRLGALTSPR